MMNSHSAALVSAAERLRLEEGAHKVASRLIGLAAAMLLLEGTKEQDLDRAMVAAFREFAHDEAARGAH